ncbi:MAG: response regulator [Candidatus Limnocylindria bacterium]
MGTGPRAWVYRSGTNHAVKGFMKRGNADGRQHSVLVVDDDGSVRSLFVDALTGVGHAVDTAVDGADALERLQAGNAPCVVLTDLRMPRMDGWELSRAVARDPQLASIPVVVVTGDKVLSFTSPARDKPWSVAELDTIVQRSCSLHRTGGGRR